MLNENTSDRHSVRLSASFSGGETGFSPRPDVGLQRREEPAWLGQLLRTNRLTTTAGALAAILDWLRRVTRNALVPR